MSTPLLDGPSLPPASGRPAAALVVLLHGYGADGADLIDVARAVSPMLPDIAFVAPDAPDRLPGGYPGRQWFPLASRDRAELWRGAVAARPALDAFLDAELGRQGLDDRRLILAGFSQGAMMALHLGLRRPVAALLGFSGVLPGPEHLGEITHRPPVTLVHGDRDQTVPFAMMVLTAEALRGAGVPVETHVRPGLGHGIDQQGLQIATAAIRAALAPADA